MANLIYFEKEQLPQSLANRLIRLAAFQNPEFYKAQAMRFPVWNKPRIIGCAENYPRHIALPRGCLEAVQKLLRENNIRCELQDKHFAGNAIDVNFDGTLQQYAGRLHRQHTSKTDVKIIDFVDTGHPLLLKMWDKRQRGYRAMGYCITAGNTFNSGQSAPC